MLRSAEYRHICDFSQKLSLSKHPDLEDKQANKQACTSPAPLQHLSSTSLQHLLSEGLSKGAFLVGFLGPCLEPKDADYIGDSQPTAPGGGGSGKDQRMGEGEG